MVLEYIPSKEDCGLCSPDAERREMLLRINCPRGDVDVGDTDSGVNEERIKAEEEINDDDDLVEEEEIKRNR